jgi:hypothetical protein
LNTFNLIIIFIIFNSNILKHFFYDTDKFILVGIAPLRIYKDLKNYKNFKSDLDKIGGFMV